MRTDEIRELYLSYFEDHGHLRLPSASLVPSPDDTSTLLTVAGMQPFKPYFEGREQPPKRRVTSCQRSFRTVDIEVVGTTKRHLTFFEMLGNFSFADYFKREAMNYAWELSLDGFGFDPERVWVTVFEGDGELGLGPDEEAIAIWREIGVPDERIVALPREENFWQGGDSGPCGPSSELYIDRGPEFGGDELRPGDDTDRYLEYWNLVFTQYQLHTDGSLSELPTKNIDTGLGLERMAVIQQGVDSVFETDGFRPLIELAAELSGLGYGDDERATRAMRVLADHVRGSVNLIGDGVVPSNEDRGYVLRRILRRAIQQGRSLGLEPPFMGRFAGRAIETMADAYPQLAKQYGTILRWVGDEEQGFGRTLDRGTELLERVIADAERSGTSWIDAEDAFRLHDTYGFPYDLTRQLLAERGLTVDDDGFAALMEAQRERARVGSGVAAADGHEAVISFVSANPPTGFVGYEQLAARTSVAAAEPLGDDAVLVKLEESPFYAEGGGQVADSGVLRWDGGEASVSEVFRVGEDQAVALGTRHSALGAGTSVEAVVDRETRHATMRNHTATHLLHAALRERLGTHVRQAGSAVRPDKLRFDFTHGSPLSADDARAVEDRVNEWIKASRSVRALQMARAEAEAMGAMALFGEKYGDWVRVVEVDAVSRELCGGTHVANTAEVGLFTISSEGSSAANVRRVEAITGPAAIDLFRARSEALAETGALLGDERDPVAAARRASERLAELERGSEERRRERVAGAAERIGDSAERVGGVRVIAEVGPITDQSGLLELADRIKQRGGDAAVVLGAAGDEKVVLVASFTKGAVDRGLSAVEVVREAAAVVGGGGGGREDVAQAGGREPERLDQALRTAREAMARALSA